MQLTLIPIFILAATASAQGWPGGNQYQQPSQYQQVPPGPPGNQGGSWSYQQTYNPPAPAREFKTISPSEADDWRSCTNGFLLSIDRGDDGSGPACNFWECLHIQAAKWGRGGLLTAASEILSPICSGANVISNIGGHIPFIGGAVS
ncbi:hypothetical protein BKA64DRAFT_19049 [Cadophora sp. MPI-SDFR-AT-0126]|nr:hypothetical protein BKA64DRAFT_19049 [Leotiomycetes sp. MPI-SDFR-AT-0126]